MPTPNEPPETVPDDPPTTVGTPEGDNEFGPDQPLAPLPVDAELDPPGSAPDDYRQEKDRV